MSQKRYGFLVRLSDGPGASTAKQYVTASNQYEASQMAKTLFGRMLVTESAVEIID